MAFEDLQKAFIEADLEKLREKGAALKFDGKAKPPTGKKATKGKKKNAGKKIADEKLALTKDLKKTKGKAKLKTPKEIEEAKKKAKEKAAKEAEKKEAQKDKDGKEKEPTADPSFSKDTGINTNTDPSLYQQKFYLPEDKERVSGLDQLEAINKLPAPEDKVLPKEEKEQPAQEKQQTAEDRFKQLREALGGKVASTSSLTPPKTPITAEVKAAKEAAAKDSGASMNAILALHSNKKSE